MDPHKRSVTIEVMTGQENVVGGGRFATDVDGFAAMLAYVEREDRIPDRALSDGTAASAVHRSRSPSPGCSVGRGPLRGQRNFRPPRQSRCL